MTEESDLTASVGPDDVVAPQVEATEGQAESQTAPPEPEGESEEHKSDAAKRRERDKAYKERLRQEAAEANARAEAAEARKQKIIKAGESEKPPTEAEFPDFVELAAAKAVWSARQANRTDQLAALDEEATEARKKADIIAAAERELIARSWSEQVQAAKQRYADFETVAYSAPISDEVAKLIAVSEVGTDVAYFLGQNPKLALEISRMSPVEAARAIGRIEASVNVPKARTQSSAPEPVSPVKGAAKTSKDPARMSYAEFKAYRDAGGKL